MNWVSKEGRALLAAVPSALALVKGGARGAGLIGRVLDKKCLLVLILSMMLSPVSARGGNYTVFVDQDGWLKESAPSKNHGNDKELSSKNKVGDSFRAVYRFDLSSVPAGEFVTSATAQFYLSGEDDSGAPVSVYRITKAWSENGARWVNLGNDYDNTTIYGSFIPSPKGLVTVDITSLVREWLDGTHPNHGLMFISTSADRESKYASKEWDTASERPRLDIVTTNADIAVTKTADNSTVNEGDTISYTVTVTNNGPGDHPAVDLTDVLPPGVTYLSDVPSQGAYDTLTGLWLVGSVTNGASATLDLTVTVNGGTGGSTITNTAFLASPDPDTSNNSDSAAITVQFAALVIGLVFEDRDHDGVFGPGDVGLAGVRVVEDNTGLVEVTGGDGSFMFRVASGASVIIIEQNPSGFVSLSPDTIGPVVLATGDTLNVDFADVRPMYLSPGSVRTGAAGAYVDFPHRIEVGTRGRVTLTATADPGVVTMYLLDVDANGIFDGTDRTLQASDLDMDPALGNTTVAFLLRVFVPVTTPLGTTLQVITDAVQPISGTVLSTSAQAMDALIVVGSQLGQVTLQKSVDSATAAPGDVVTYTITFFNPGADSVQNIVILDPVSQYVDPLIDAFGPGQDVEWARSGLPVLYLTLDPADADECEYSTSERLLRLLFSKNGPFFLLPGQSGTLSYRVTVQ